MPRADVNINEGGGGVGETAAVSNGASSGTSSSSASTKSTSSSSASAGSSHKSKSHSHHAKSNQSQHVAAVNTSADDLGSGDEIKVYKDEGPEEGENLNGDKNDLIIEQEDVKPSLPFNISSMLNGSGFGASNANELLANQQALLRNLYNPAAALWPAAAAAAWWPAAAAAASFYPPHLRDSFPFSSPFASATNAYMQQAQQAALSRFSPFFNGSAPSNGSSAPSPGANPFAPAPNNNNFKQSNSQFAPQMNRAQDFSANPPHHHRKGDRQNASMAASMSGTDVEASPAKSKRPHIKKPLNAFMLFMREQRAQVVSECTLRESAAINQILGRKWHELDRAEQAKYYEMARQERLKHLQLYPGWSARDNYGLKKKRRKKREKSIGENGELPRKCRARYGLQQINMWCKPCRRKKKCIRFTNRDDMMMMGGQGMMAPGMNGEMMPGGGMNYPMGMGMPGIFGAGSVGEGSSGGVQSGGSLNGANSDDDYDENDAMDDEDDETDDDDEHDDDDSGDSDMENKHNSKQTHPSMMHHHMGAAMGVPGAHLAHHFGAHHMAAAAAHHQLNAMPMRANLNNMAPGALGVAALGAPLDQHRNDLIVKPDPM